MINVVHAKEKDYYCKILFYKINIYWIIKCIREWIEIINLCIPTKKIRMF